MNWRRILTSEVITKRATVPGRTVQIRLHEGFFITFWLDNHVKELRVINIERA